MKTLFIMMITILSLSNAYAIVKASDDKTELCKEIKNLAYPSTQCRSDYHHFPPASSYKRKSIRRSQLKIAGFNMLQPGTNTAKYKHVPSIVNMMNKWDVIGATELMALDNYTVKYNGFVKAAINSATSTTQRNKFKKMYRIPGYLDLLKRLQKKDKTWGLFVSTATQGTQSANIREIVGIFYRGSKVQPAHNAYCGKKYSKSSKSYACLPKFSSSIESQFSRKPIMATFKAGNFKFTLLTTHVVFGIGKSDWTPRLNEVGHITKLMRDRTLQSTTKNIILVGDLNLPYDQKNIHTALNGFDIFQTDLSSISAKYAYSEDYDHFVFDQSQITECDGASAEVFDFLNKTPVMKKYEPMTVNDARCSKNSHGRYAKVAKSRVRNLQDVYCAYMGKIANDTKVTKKLEIVWEHNEKAMKTLSTKFLGTIVYSQAKESQQFRKYMSVISDHAPIHMSCSTL